MIARPPQPPLFPYTTLFRSQATEVTTLKGAAMKRCPKYLVYAVVALCAVSAFAQFQTGNIYGKVQAKDGSVLPGVTVVLTGVGAPMTTITGPQGEFRFLSLSPGTYSL